jgi:hypothetical protein
MGTSAFGDIGLIEEAKQCAAYLRRNGWPVPANCCKFFATCQNAPAPVSQKAPAPVSCPEDYAVATPTGCLPRAKADCNSETYRGCLAEVTKDFEAYLDEVCNGKTPAHEFLADIGWGEARTAGGLGLEAVKLGRSVRKWMADPTATGGELKRITGGGFGRGPIYLFLLTAAWDIHKLVTAYPGWTGDFDKCHDTADRLKTLESDDVCARESGCWPRK